MKSLIWGLTAALLVGCAEPEYSSVPDSSTTQGQSVHGGNRNIGSGSPDFSNSVPTPSPGQVTPPPSQVQNPVPNAPAPAATPPPQQVTQPMPPADPCPAGANRCLRTLLRPSPVAWKTTGFVCRPYGYVSDVSVGHAQPCTKPGELTTVEWASALPQPNGCPLGEATVFVNTYVCKSCPSGNWKATYYDINIAAGYYPHSGWMTPAHTIPNQPVLSCAN